MVETFSRKTIESLDSPLLQHFEFYEEIDSTQGRAHELALSGAPHGTLVISRVQTGGRGRRGRSWGSPPGGIWMSLVLRPDLEIKHVPRITQAAAVGVAKALNVLGVEARIKWPNDLLVKGRKICGILAAGASRSPMPGRITVTPAFVTLGIGLNANLDVQDLDAPVDEVTSIRPEIGRDVDLTGLLEHLLAHINRELKRIEDFENILSDWRKLDCTLGRKVRIHGSDSILEGTALDINSEGALILDTEEDKVELYEGDVEHLRLPKQHR